MIAPMSLDEPLWVWEGTEDPGKEAESQTSSCPRSLGGDLILTPRMETGAMVPNGAEVQSQLFSPEGPL